MNRTFEDISVVLQGPVVRTPATSADVAIDQILASLREHLPGAKIILSTWAGTPTEGLDVDDVVLSEDPGPQGPLKAGCAHANNGNRQIVSTVAGLARVRTTYAAKMRTDCYLTGHGFVALQKAYAARDADFALLKERIVSLRFFNINPRAIQPTPFHVGDCFQFGRTEDIRFLWSGGPMSDADASWFTRRKHAAKAPRKVRAFNTRFAVEQHVFLTAAKSRIDIACDSIDDVTSKNVRQSERLFANNVIVADPGQSGVAMPKHAHMMNSLQEDYNCYNHLDWLALYRKHAGGTLTWALRREIAKRRLLRGVYATIRRQEWVAAVLETPALRNAWGALFDRLLRPGNKRT